MASFKPTKIQVYPKLGEKVTQDTLYWKDYKVSVSFTLLFIALNVLCNKKYNERNTWNYFSMYFPHRHQSR